MSCKKSGCTRREFLAFSAGAAAAMACGGGTGAGGTGGDVAAGNVSQLSIGSVKVLSDASIVVMRDSQGLYAMSLICTHSGCDMSTQGSVTAQKVICACHNSQFGPNGEVLRGPAYQALTHYSVSVDGSGNITVHGGQEVAASTRTAV